jgi:GH18 family chitinase
MRMDIRFNLLVFSKGQREHFELTEDKWRAWLIRQELKDAYAFIVNGKATDHWYDIVFSSSDDPRSVTKSKAEFIKKNDLARYIQLLFV